MPLKIAPSGDRRRLSNGIAVGNRLPWLDGKMPGSFDPLDDSPTFPEPGLKVSTYASRPVRNQDQNLAKRDHEPRVAAPTSILNPSKSPPSRRQSLFANPKTPVPAHIDDEDLSPTQSIHKEASRTLGSEEAGLQRAVTDLERLMKEAVQVALEAAEQGRSNEMEDIVQTSTKPDRRASVKSVQAKPSPLVVDTSSDSSSSDHKPPEEPPHDSAIEIQTLRVPVSVQRSPEPSLPQQATFCGSTTKKKYEPPNLHPLHENKNKTAAKRRVSIPRNDIVQTKDWASPRHRSLTVLEPIPIPETWSPKRANTALLDEDPSIPPGTARSDTGLAITEDDFLRPENRKRHHRNPDWHATNSVLRRKPDSSTHKHKGFNFGHHTRRQPIARKWSTLRKRFTATIACINTGFMGYVIGVYAGEVPRIQYQVVDPNHYIILGNVVLFLGLAFTTFVCWPLPLLHGRKPYTLGAFAIVLPLQFPQAVVVSSVRPPSDQSFRTGLLLARFFTGLALGLANINFVTTLLDLFGASLQSSNPHQELVIIDDVRRQGGGMGIWLGIWSWCFVGSIALGFLTGAGIIAHLNPSWGFYITCIVGVVVLLLNVMAPETRRSPYRRSLTEYVDEEEKTRRRIARGEVKLHIDTKGPMWWGQEAWAGIRLNFKMLCQSGFLTLAVYLGWTYALVVLIIVLLGSLLSREYHWRPQYVGLGVFAIAIGAMLAVPLSKAGLFSRDRTKGPRTDSMTFERQATWSSHMVRRIIFMVVLPLAGLAYTLSTSGRKTHWVLPIIFAGLIGFLSNLAIAECIGLIMETFDTSDLQPGVNSRHRLKSMASAVKRRRTNYSSFPRVTSGIFVAQSIGFLLAAAATGVGGVMTRTLGSQTATAITAAVLMLLTILLTVVLLRFKSVQVIPNHAFGTRMNTFDWGEKVDEYWKPVVIGNPSGKLRRMSILELGKMSRWTEIRILNNLIRTKSRSGQEAS